MEGEAHRCQLRETSPGILLNRGLRNLLKVVIMKIGFMRYDGAREANIDTWKRKAVTVLLNVDRIKLMTGLTAYEERAGKKALTITKYFKNDYIIMNLISVAVTTTLAFILLLVMWGFYKADYLLNSLTSISLVSAGIRLAIVYLVFLAVFLTIAYFVYADKYEKAKKSVSEYVEKLKALENFYKEEEKTKAGYTAPVGGMLKYDDFTGV